MPTEVQMDDAVSVVKTRKARTPSPVFKPDASFIVGDGSLLENLELIEFNPADGDNPDPAEIVDSVICCVASWLDANLVKGLSPDVMQQLGVKLKRFPGGTSFVVDA